MPDRAKQLLSDIAQDWESRRIVFTTDIERRMQKLATLGELMLIDGSEEVQWAFFDIVAIELASARLIGEAEVREAINDSVLRIVRFAVAAVGAV
jgi:hypothetical protein